MFDPIKINGQLVNNVYATQPVPDHTKTLLSILQSGQASISEVCLGPMPIYNGFLSAVKINDDTAELPHVAPLVDHHNSVYLRCSGHDPERWCLYNGACCLNKEGEWEYQPMPSSRDEDFFERCRWETPQEALEFWLQWKDQAVKEFIEANT